MLYYTSNSKIKVLKITSSLFLRFCSNYKNFLIISGYKFTLTSEFQELDYI